MDEKSQLAIFTNTAHGNRGGGPLHSLATRDQSGFMSPDDKAVVEDIPAEVSAIEESIDEAEALASESANLILTELRISTWLLSRLLIAANPNTAEIDLDELRGEFSGPLSELQTINWLLARLLEAHTQRTD